MKSFYPKGNWVKWKSRIEESVESLIKWAFEKTVNKSWQNRWESRFFLHKGLKVGKSPVFMWAAADGKTFINYRRLS